MAGEAVAGFAIANNICIPFVSQNIRENVSPSEDLAGMFACRRKLRPAVLQMTPGKHSGLGLEYYTRVTSPLRRYLDLVVHQQFRAYLNNDLLMDEETISNKIYGVRTVVGNNMMVERNSNRHWTLVYMDSVKWRGEAILVDKYENKGTFIIPELAFETRLAIDKGMELNSKAMLSFNGCDLSTLTGYFTCL
jgi:exoribonuclease II